MVIFFEPKNHSKNWTSGCHFEKKEVNLRMPLLKTQVSDLNFSKQTILTSRKWHSEVQIWHSIFKSGIRRFTSFSSKWHGEVQFQEWFLGPEKIDHKKLAIRKKNLAKNGEHLPPKIKVQKRAELYGTSGIISSDPHQSLEASSDTRPWTCAPRSPRPQPLGLSPWR